MQIFISYKREDEPFARRLRDTVRNFGYTTWMDIDNIEQGAYWPDEIDKGLQASQIIVGVLSPESVVSRNVKNEWDWALANGRRLLLLLLRPCSIPHRYVAINHINFAESEEQGFSRLNAALTNPDTPIYHDDVQVTTRETTSPQPEPSPQDRNRARMLQKVRQFWIAGVLDQSLQDTTLIELGMEHKPEAVLQHTDYPRYPLPAGAKIGAVFDDVGRELLILGAPGSGKTTLLLELARDLLARAETDDNQPMPIVFNLSTWAVERKSLAVWLVDELTARYQVPPRVGKLWVDNGKILALLDGLDEVRAEQRDACVEAINRFRREYSFVDMAVCSRSADYEALTQRLNLRTAIVLQPLSDAQVESYLSQLGGEVSALREMLQTDETLREEARSPLMLNIMTVAYRNMPVRALSGFTTIATRRQHLFENYVERRFKQSASPEYTLRQTIHWLAWLARKMVDNSQTVFHIERMQPDWLPTQAQRIQYALGVGVIVTLLAGAVFGVSLQQFIFWQQFLTGSADAVPLALRSGVSGGIVLGLIFGAWGALGSLTRWRSINVIETLNWSWRQSFIGMGIGIIGGLLAGLLGSALLRVALMLALGTSGGFIGGLIQREIEMRVSPNQGIRKSLYNALVIGVMVFLTVTLAFLVAPFFAESNNSLLFLVAIGALFGAILALASALIFGGFTVIKHAVLRLLLWRADYTPLNYARFLNYASGRVLLRQVGGGYIFRHRLLLEYFASNHSSA